MVKLEQFHNIVDGEKTSAASGRWFPSFNPFTGEAWAEIPHCGEADVDRAVTAAERAFTHGDWPKLSASARGKLLNRFADLLQDEAERLARIETRDNGKLLAEMSGQLRYIPEWFRYFGGLADKIEGAVLPIDKPSMFAFTRREPLGVVATITPWNSPLLLLAWKLAPALAAGNTIVIKPSEYASASTLAFAELFAKAGFPKGVVNTLTGYGAEIGQRLTEHPLIAKIAFTGGDATGAQVGAAATRQLKHVTLELGGKSPNIVFADARMDNAVKGAIAGIFAATGQTCIAGSRLLVERSIHDDFVDRLVALARQARLGDPMLAETQVGPITTEAQLKKVLNYIDIAKTEGAKLLLGGKRPEASHLAQGWFVEPTIFDHVDNRMRIAREEVFGPVLSIIPFENEDDAVSIANDNAYGLAAGIWTEDTRRALRLAERIRAGTVWINTYRAVSYLAPFGGMKRSGLGRESGMQAIDEYLQTKSVWMNLAEDFPNPFVLR
jgi:acyl-CoA reductase-like NAD-dependent aldehyde dehydrogenase